MFSDSETEFGIHRKEGKIPLRNHNRVKKIAAFAEIYHSFTGNFRRKESETHIRFFLLIPNRKFTRGLKFKTSRCETAREWKNWKFGAEITRFFAAFSRNYWKMKALSQRSNAKQLFLSDLQQKKKKQMKITASAAPASKGQKSQQKSLK